MSSPIEYIEYEVLEDYDDCSITKGDDENELSNSAAVNNLKDVTGSDVDSIIKKDDVEIEFYSYAVLYSDSETDNSEVDVAFCKETTKKTKPKRSKVPKKRTRNPESWKQNIRIKRRQKGLPYINSSGVEMPGKSMGPVCTSTCLQTCTKSISSAERQRIHENFWNLSYKEKQIFYSNSIKRTEIKRRRTHCNKEADPKRKNSYKYYFSVDNRNIQVCKKYFLNTLAVSSGAISSFLANYFDKDIIQSFSKPSNRGRKRKSSELQTHQTSISECKGDDSVNAIDHNNFVSCEVLRTNFEGVASNCNAEVLVVKQEDQTEFICCPSGNSDFESASLEIHKVNTCESGYEIEVDCLEVGKISCGIPSLDIKRGRVFSKPEKKIRNTEMRKQHIRQNGVEILGKYMGPLCTSACLYSCAKNISSKNRQRIFENFWKLTCEQKQQFYSNCIKKTEIKRRRPHCNKENDAKKKNSYQYFFNVNNRNIQVCKKYFLNTLAVPATAIYGFFAKQREMNTFQSEGRRKGSKLVEAFDGDSFGDGLLIEADEENEGAVCSTLDNDFADDTFADFSIVENDDESEFDGSALSNDKLKADCLETGESASEIDCTSNIEYFKSKKRTRNPEMWKQNIRKNLRAKGLPYTNSNGVEVPGKSIGPTCALMCFYSCTKKISSKKRQRIHDDFWNLTLEEKHAFYRHHIKRSEIKRRRSQCKQETDPKRKNTYKYYFNVNNRIIQVCKKYFLNTLAISAGAISHFFANHDESISKSSKRGRKGHSQIQIEEVKNHIRSFPTVKKQRCISSSLSTQEYLNENLNVKKMYNLYKESAADPVGLQTYRNVFNTCFAYSFYNSKVVCD